MLLFGVIMGVFIGILKFILLCGWMCLVMGCKWWGLNGEEIWVVNNNGWCVKFLVSVFLWLL